MKLKTTLLAVALATFAASTAITFAAEELPADIKSETPKTEKAKKPLKKHNHMEEKTGMPISEPVAGSTAASTETHEPAKKATKHDHTIDRH